ncbi:hypothetical protein AMK59_3749 [Oryctes borbonicus]|uniref:Vitellogenin domain-containing protein n=1 Tax=Oryctes borbonicus TaxID=1629725 RepID=A0A0T6B669_9SCAR|nr:hypothetical protein AMK59_3749 [Oryctes borbonicus]
MNYVKMKLTAILTLLLFITLSSSTQNNPLKNPHICGRPTCKGNGKFRYLKGVEHRYMYSVNVRSLFNGTNKNESTLYIQAEAQIDFVSECDGLLTLADVRLSENPNSKLTNADDTDYYDENGETESTHENNEPFSEALQEFSVRFAFQDGIISEVCPDFGEKNWVLNFKKGLLSLLHNTMKRFDLDHRGNEDDIHGKCETTYRGLEPNGTSLMIEKTKDLTYCESRSKLHSFVQSTSYNFRPVSHDSKLLKSSSKCIISVDHYIYKEINCVETHVFQPFSNQNAGATTLVNQRLILLEEQTKELDDLPYIEKRTTLSYDPVPTPKPLTDELQLSRDLIKKLCRLSGDELQIEFSDLFTKFIHTARFLSYNVLNVLYKRAGSICPTGKKHVLDALPYLGTSAAVGIMRDTTSESTINEWMLSVALIPRPDLKMLEYLFQLLERSKMPSVSLAVSSLTYTYCIQNSDCTSQEVIAGIIQLLESRANRAYTSKKYDRRTQETITVNLKSLSNIGIIRKTFETKLNNIIEDRAIDISIRVTAIETYRRTNCEQTRSYFEDLFRNKEEESEVRIAAYLQVMRCPNYVVVGTIRHSLEVEEVNQVGSFIWSHLHNLLKSSIPSRVEIQGLLSDKELVKKFSTDVRKFSNNYEGSVFFDEYNIGANYESNVIFSPSSYIPRSAMLNLTVDLFGESINLLEVYSRFEGFEQRLESLFGPKGRFSGKNVKDKVTKMKWTRDIDDGNMIRKEIDKYSDVIDNNFDHPKIDLGMKIFGNELKYTTFNGDGEVMSALNNLNPIQHLRRIFSGKEIKYNKAAMFMDTSYIVPIGAGLPLTLNAVGTSSINMKLWGKLNSTNFIENKSVDLNANIQPNIALDIVGTMSVDAYYASTGIKLKTSLYTSSAVEASVTIRGAELIRVTFGVPKQTTEMLGAKSELIVMKGSLEELQSGIEKNKVSHSMCTWPAVDRTIGLKLCADYHFINVTTMNNTANFVLAGPSGFRLALQKIDPKARTYFMEYQRKVDDNRNYITFVLDTPGAHISRLVSINITHNKESGNLTLQLFSAAGHVLAHGKYKNTDLEKYIDIGLDIDKQRKFGTVLSLSKKKINFGYNYIPKLFITVNNESVAELQGTLKWVEKSGISQSDVNLKFKTKRLTSKLFGYISKTDNSVGANLKLDYKFVNTRSEVVRLDFSLANKSKRIIAKYIGQAQVQTSAYPNMNLNASLQFQKASGYTEFDMKFECGPELFHAIRKPSTTFKAFLAHRTLVNATKLQVDASLTKPSSGLDLKTALVYERMGYWVDTKALIRYNTGKEIMIQAFWSYPKQVLDDIEARLNITVPSYTPMILKVKVKEQNFHNYAIDVEGVWFTGFNVSMKGIYNYRSIVTMSQHHLKMMLRSPSFNEINADLQYYRDNKELKIDLKADHNNDVYEFYIKHVAESNLEMVTLGKIRYKTKIYSVMNYISWKDEKEVKLELHVDQLRDIHLAMWGHNKEAHKAIGFEIKWDANRDPNQKLVVTAQISNPAPYNYDGNFVIAYPGRTINGLYNFLWITEKFSAIAHLAWSPEDAFTTKLSIEYRDAKETYFYLKSELLTPFEDVRRTALNLGYLHFGNMHRINGSVHWQHDQHVAVDLFEDYEVMATHFRCELKSHIASTIKDIPSISASLKHSHNFSQIDSNLHIMYDPKQIINLGSSWKIDGNETMRNLTGTVTILTPFRGMNKGLLVSKIYMTKSRNIRGVADLDVDHRKFRATVQGRILKFEDKTSSNLVCREFPKVNKEYVKVRYNNSI